MRQLLEVIRATTVVVNAWIIARVISGWRRVDHHRALEWRQRQLSTAQANEDRGMVTHDIPGPLEVDAQQRWEVDDASI